MHFNFKSEFYRCSNLCYQQSLWVNDQFMLNYAKYRIWRHVSIFVKTIESNWDQGLFSNCPFLNISVAFWKLSKRIIETEEKNAENSRARMPDVKQTRLRKVFGQIQYQVKGSKKDNLPEYGSQKPTTSQSGQNSNISLSDITNLKPKIE